MLYLVLLQLKKQIVKQCVFFYFMFLINGCPTSIKEKAMSVLLFDTFNGCSSPIKEMNRLIWNGMSSIYYWKKLTFSKHRFSRKENLKKYTNFEEQKSTNYIRGNLQLSFTYKTVSQISFKWFCSEDKRLLSKFLRKGGKFQGHNERFPTCLG